MTRILEIIVCTVEDAVAAERGGADRLEIISHYEAGGLIERAPEKNDNDKSKQLKFFARPPRTERSMSDERIGVGKKSRAWRWRNGYGNSPELIKA